jgi:hypothetical protein
MRYVQRKATRLMQPRPPWTWREEWPTEAPRTCLSNHKVPVFVDRRGRGFMVGRLDYMLRLYQHMGISEQSAVQDGMVMYDAFEWDAVGHVAEWFEYVDNRREIVFRIGKREAVTSVRLIETDDGPRYGIPLSAYSAHERD